MVVEPGAGSSLLDQALIKGRSMLGNEPTAYVCEDYVCKMPVTTPQELAEQLGLGL